MADLEFEFQELVDGLYLEISRKKTDGELTDYEATKLTDIVQDMVASARHRNGWYSSNCSIGDDYYYDEGWNSSSVNC